MNVKNVIHVEWQFLNCERLSADSWYDSWAGHRKELISDTLVEFETRFQKYLVTKGNCDISINQLKQNNLRDSYNIDITINRSFSMDKSYYYVITKDNKEPSDEFVQSSVPNRSYEQCLNDAVNKAIELI